MQIATSPLDGARSLRSPDNVVAGLSSEQLGPLSTASVGNPGSVIGARGRLGARLRAMIATFQAGHASSILVTRSAVKALVKGLFCVAAMLLRGTPLRLGHYAGHRCGPPTGP